MALVVFGATFLAGTAIHTVTTWLASGAQRRSSMAISPGLLPPIGVLFGLLIAFTAAQVWNDTERANVAVATEAGALRSVVVLSAVLPDEAKIRLRALVREYIEYTIDNEWPMMAQGSLTLKISPPALNRALQFTLSLEANTPGQQTTQRQLATYLEQALDARRQRILVSRAEVNGVKWASLTFLAVCLLLATALVHCENRYTSAVAIALSCAAIATTMLLILSHDRPFAGVVAVKPEPLYQVMPADR
jgi:hypothetical protein